MRFFARTRQRKNLPGLRPRPYSLAMEKVSHLGQTLTRWRVGQSTFLALPEKGARLMNWNITLGDGTVRDVLYWPELKTLDDLYKVRGGNPILFPFNARTYDRGEIQFWRDAAGVRRPMPMHGLARQGDFKLTRLDAGGFSAQFVPGAEARAAYPFDYEFTVTYRFEPFGLVCELTLRNLGREPLPWSAGHHFYFTVPWSEGASRGDYLIRIPAAKRARQDFTTGQLLPGPALHADENLANPALIDTIHLGLRSNTIVFGEKGRAGDISLRLGHAKVPPPDAAIVTWSGSDDAPYYCVEPWMGPPNAPEHKIGLHLVPPGETETFSVSIAVK
ncbi:MAG: aldose epimerase [Verrucomicrobia bacterium]|nr:aldose epimerase [Verrucomicrobiota bacterium]